MKTLTQKEEIEILNKIKNQIPLGFGSSRAVFDFENNTVVKVATDNGGFNQNYHEIDLYKKHGNSFLAEILAYGTHIIVMEKVKPLERDILEETFDANYEWWEDNDEYMSESTLKEYREMYELNELLEDVVYELEAIHGATQDNLQIGIRESTGELVCYDYGYTPDIEHDQQVDYLNGDEIPTTIINLMRQMA